ncbi:SRPBCC family protein [Actinacidiphila paucisporea]|uniref:Polyketide cyclase / dehydrase and lipid transport n=1 Tax=Actinacidiphila paucisporea TaxID=310782 RepID=A0A1M7R0W2_9ACTN|nr:SRPBCC family protein [Actinacidiphila paucisporea]SHN38212.1 Polyketide cyclase / dehydrase and lipid transport [Actinacidiphila paucisporea]
MDEVSIWVGAAPEAVWAVVADPTRYGEWSPENQGGRWQGGAAPGPGAVFKGTNKRGVVRWSTTCTVLEYDAPKRFTFEVAESRMRWGYRLEPQAGGTLITEWREHAGPLPIPARIITASRLLGRDREQLMVDGMQATLERVKRAVETDRR